MTHAVTSGSNDWHVRQEIYRNDRPIGSSRSAAVWYPRTRIWEITGRSIIRGEFCEFEAVLDENLDLCRYTFSCENLARGSELVRMEGWRIPRAVCFASRAPGPETILVLSGASERVYPTTLIPFLLSLNARNQPGSATLPLRAIYENTCEIMDVDFERSGGTLGRDDIVEFVASIKGMQMHQYLNNRGEILGARLGDICSVSRSGMGLRPLWDRPALDRSVPAADPAQAFGDEPDRTGVNYWDIRVSCSAPVNPISDGRQRVLCGPARSDGVWKTEIRIWEVTDWLEHQPVRGTLLPTALLQSDSEEIKLTAVQIANGATDPLESARRLTTWCFQSLRYRSGGPIDAKSVLRLRKAECQGASNLLIAMCRSIAIPSRPVAGFLIPQGGDDRRRPLFHQWAEVYDGRRWHGLDPTQGGAVSPSHVKLVEIDQPSDTWRMYPVLDSLTVKVIGHKE